jgi:hypothetical protein
VTELYRISAKVLPATWHPKFYEWQFGFLSLWLFAISAEDAAEKANVIIEALPFERIDNLFAIESQFPRTEESLALQGGAQEQAEQTGFALRLAACRTGADQDEFEAQPLT